MNLPSLTPANFTFPFLSLLCLGRSPQHQQLVRIAGATGLSSGTVGRAGPQNGGLWVTVWITCSGETRFKKAALKDFGVFSLVSPLGHMWPWEIDLRWEIKCMMSEPPRRKPASPLHFPHLVWVEGEKSKAFSSVNLNVQPF